MKNITVVHPSFNVLGGAERVALKVIEAISEEGFSVNVITFDAIGIKEFLRFFPSQTNIQVQELSHLKLLPSINRGIIQNLLLYPTLRRLRNSSVIVNTKFNELPTLADIIYIHYPFYFIAFKNPLDPSFINGPALGKQIKSSVYKPYVKASGYIGSTISLNYIKKASRVLFNSIYTYTLFRHYIDVVKQISKYLILNPPIDDAYFKEHLHEKEKIIVMRTKGVRSEIVADIVLKLAKTLRNWNIVIIGFTDKKYYNAVKQKLNSVNVKLLLNIDETTKRKILSRATLYVHLTPYEHFGILIGEALASGCRVIVHKFSGIVYDILSKYSIQDVEKCVSTYNNFLEIPNIASDIARDENYNPQHCRSLVTPFSESIFKERVKEIIMRIT